MKKTICEIDPRLEFIITDDIIRDTTLFVKEIVKVTLNKNIDSINSIKVILFIFNHKLDKLDQVKISELNLSKQFELIEFLNNNHIDLSIELLKYIFSNNTIPVDLAIEILRN